MLNETAEVQKVSEFKGYIDFDFIEILKFFFRSKGIIFTGILIGLLLGLFYLKMTPETYVSLIQVNPIGNEIASYNSDMYENVIDKNKGKIVSEFEKVVVLDSRNKELKKSNIQFKNDRDNFGFYFSTHLSGKVEISELSRIVSITNDWIKKYDEEISKKITEEQMIEQKILKSKYDILRNMHGKIFEIQKKYNLVDNDNYKKMWMLSNNGGDLSYNILFILEYLKMEKKISYSDYYHYLDDLLKMSFSLENANQDLINNRKINGMKEEILPLLSLSNVVTINQLEDKQTAKIIFSGILFGLILSFLFCILWNLKSKFNTK